MRIELFSSVKNVAVTGIDCGADSVSLLNQAHRDLHGERTPEHLCHFQLEQESVRSRHRKMPSEAPQAAVENAIADCEGDTDKRTVFS